MVAYWWLGKGSLIEPWWSPDRTLVLGEGLGKRFLIDTGYYTAQKIGSYGLKCPKSVQLWVADGSLMDH